jgi:hypothetical protein
LQERGFAIAAQHAHLPLQDRLGIIAKVFNAQSAEIKTRPCGGKYRGTSDVSIEFDTRASLYIGNRPTPKAKQKGVINEMVNDTLARYNPETVREAKEKAASALKAREAIDNAIALEKGLKPYKFLTVELNDGSHYPSGGNMGWWYATLAVDGKVFGFSETGLNYDIADGKLTAKPKRENYFVAGGLKDDEAEFVFNNVGHGVEKIYSMPISDEVRQRAEAALAERDGNPQKEVKQLKNETVYYGDFGDPAKPTPPPKEPKEQIAPPTAEEAAAKRHDEILHGDNPMPDPFYTIGDMERYGYTNGDMLPLQHETALGLFDQGHTVYLLYDDSTEAIAFDREDIEGFDGFFGIERGEWESIVDSVRAADAMDNGEAANEAQLLYGSENLFGIYQIPAGIDELRDFRFTGMKELETLGLKPDRDNYTLVYTGKLNIRDTQTNLHKIYNDFNMNRPTDYIGRSLSVSDVIVLQWRGKVSSHYVDSFGFKELPGFLGEETPRGQDKQQAPGNEQPTFSAMRKRSGKLVKTAGQQPSAKARPSLLAELEQGKKTAERLNRTAAQKTNEREV